MGDPTGIGPELIVRVLGWHERERSEEENDASQGPREAEAPVRIYGDPLVLAAAARTCGVSWPPPEALAEILPITELTPAQAPPGQPGERSGAAQVAYLSAALADAAAGVIGGICTAPIHKASAIAAGLAFPGHTELLADRLAKGRQVVMMLAGPSLRVALCTTHLRLSQVPAALTVEGVAAVLRTTALALHHDFGIAAPVLWVAGLNPHAGEQGHFGDEERTIIAPAIECARKDAALAAIPGLCLRGPKVPDAVFRAAVHPGEADGRRPDAVVAMYHDQGLIPLKLLDFDEAVNVTLGLPIVRTSPDHGVAHDIAGTGKARATSMRAALRLCQDLLRRRQGAAEVLMPPAQAPRRADQR